MHTAVIVAALALTPTPADALAADADLYAPLGSPALLDPSPRSRVAMLSAMRRAGAVDPDAESQWWPPGAAWQSELDHARGVVAQVRDCPAAWEGEWLPDLATCSRVADANRVHAARIEERFEWEPDREPILRRAHDEVSGLWCVWDQLRITAEGGQWQRPRRIRLRDARAVIGEERWERQEWPEQAAWWTLRER